MPKAKNRVGQIELALYRFNSRGQRIVKRIHLRCDVPAADVRAFNELSALLAHEDYPIHEMLEIESLKLVNSH